MFYHHGMFLSIELMTYVASYLPILHLWACNTVYMLKYALFCIIKITKIINMLKVKQLVQILNIHKNNDRM